jgi:hypothetical protein
MRIRATLDSRRARWDEYVLPVDNVFPKDLATASSDAAEELVVFDSCDGSVEFEQLMLETRAVLARQVSKHYPKNLIHKWII